jgi:hypothetical protein
MPLLLIVSHFLSNDLVTIAPFCPATVRLSLIGSNFMLFVTKFSIYETKLQILDSQLKCDS